jgi:hypothetical protein
MSKSTVAAVSSVDAEFAAISNLMTRRTDLSVKLIEAAFESLQKASALNGDRQIVGILTAFIALVSNGKPVDRDGNVLKTVNEIAKAWADGRKWVGSEQGLAKLNIKDQQKQ